MCEQLKEEFDFIGSDRTVRNYLTKRKKERINEASQAALPLESSKAGTAHVDFGEAPFKLYLCKIARQYGYPFVIKTVQNRMARLLRTANLNPELTPHSLRHKHTSLLAEAGVSLEQIMDRLGHPDDQITKMFTFT